jgi:hypothetical protein
MVFYTGFNYVTTEKVVDIGPIEINKQQSHPVVSNSWCTNHGRCCTGCKDKK